MSMPLPLEEVKLWLRLEATDTTEDTILQSIIAAAGEYLRSALPSWIDPAKNPPAKMLVLSLVADMYENRDTIADVRYAAQLAGYRQTVQSLIAQLKYAYPHVETTKLPEAKAGVEYSATVRAAGGTPPYTWQIRDGELPPGVSLDSQTGGITGIPTVAGRYTVTVEAKDMDTRTASRPVAITVVDSS